MDQKLATLLVVGAFAMIAWQQARIGDLERSLAKLDDRSFSVFAERAIQEVAIDALTKRQSAQREAIVAIGAQVMGKTPDEVEQELLRIKTKKGAAAE